MAHRRLPSPLPDRQWIELMTCSTWKRWNSWCYGCLFFFFFLTSVQSKLEKNGCRVVVFPHFTLSSQGFMSMSFNSSLICTEVLFLYSSSFEHHFCLLLFKLCNQDTVGNTWIASNFLSLPFVYWLGDLTKSETWVGWAKTTDTNTPNLLLALAVPWTTQWGAVK